MIRFVYTKSYCLCLAAFLLSFLSPATVCASEEQMTVEDAIRIGLQNNYDILIARNTADIAQNNTGKGIANFLPVIDSSGNYRYDASNEETGAPTSFGNSDTRSWSSQLSLNWTLFDGFRMFADKRRFDELALAGTQQSRNSIEITVVNIMRAFFNLVQQEQLLDVARNTRDISRTRLDREEVRRSLGGASSTDLLNARVNFNNDQSTLLDQQLAVTIARKDLNILLARNPLTPVSVKKIIDIPGFTLPMEQVLELSKKQNSALKAARHNRQVADESVKVAESAFWPRLSLSGNYGYTDRSLFGSDIGPVADRTRRTIEASAGLVLSFNLFNGNVDRINYQNARLDALNSKLALNNIENEIAGLVQEKFSTLQKRLEKVTLEEQNTVTAKQNMELQKERYATGASDSLDFRDAQVNLNRAQTTLIIARFQARIALLEIQQLIGQIAIE